MKEDKGMRKRTVATASEMQQVKLLLSVEEAAAALSLGRSLVYDLVMRGDIRSIKVRRTRRIPVEALHEFIAGQLAPAS
jgi:excisionase family DNA binding protein